MGFNCCELKTESKGRPVDLIWSPDGFSDGKHPSYTGGIPILFPFPGRIGGGAFSFEGKGYHIPQRDGLGNALHGFVLDRPWRVMEHTSSHATGRFRASTDAQGLLDLWPADFQLTARYELAGSILTCTLTAQNTDSSASLPCALGLHPYFPVPVGQGSPESCIIRVPADSIWELDNRMLPTGSKRSASGAFALKSGVPFPDTALDHVFGGLGFKDSL